MSAFCQDHPTVAAADSCNRCGRSLCELCVFLFSGIAFCPECATAGPTAEERSKVFSGGLLSVGLAVLGFIILAGLLVAGAAGQEIPSGLDSVVSVAWFACAFGGLTAGLIAREGARRTGSLLPMVGLVSSGLLLLSQVVLITIGSAR